MRPKIAFFGTGGTISNAGTGQADYVSYLDEGSVLSADEVAAMHEDVNVIADLDVVPFGRFRSRSITSSDWARLAREVTRAVNRKDISGVVISHGTGVLEETAYFLHLVLGSDKPVVLVGAQRPPYTLSSDSQINFLNAVRTAASSQAQGIGVLVVMDQVIHSARDATKSSNQALSTMESPGFGPLGTVHPDGAVRFHRKPLQFHTQRSMFLNIAETVQSRLPRVDIVYCHAESDGTAIKAFLEEGTAGLIIVGFAPGVNPPDVEQAVDIALKKSVRVVQATRSHRDRAVVRRRSLARKGIIANADLSPQHARVLLQLALHENMTAEGVQNAFYSH